MPQKINSIIYMISSATPTSHFYLDYDLRYLVWDPPHTEDVKIEPTFSFRSFCINFLIRFFDHLPHGRYIWKLRNKKMKDFKATNLIFANLIFILRDIELEDFKIVSLINCGIKKWKALRLQSFFR